MTIIEIQVDALSHIRPAAGAAVDADSIRGSCERLMMFIDSVRRAFISIQCLIC